MNHLLSCIIATSLVGVTGLAITSTSACGESKSKNKSESKSSDKKPGVTCEQMVDHMYPIMKAFRQSDKSAYAKLAKHMDESPKAVKKRKENQVRTCKQRTYSQQDLQCFLKTKSLKEIKDCANAWRARQKKPSKSSK